MTLLEAVKSWIKEDKELAHFFIEDSTNEDFDAHWIICKCSDHILATVYEDHVFVMTKPEEHMPPGLVRLPGWHRISAADPQMFELLKCDLMKYHQEYL